MALLLWCAVPLQAQGSNVVEGYVRSNDNKPIPNITVVIKNASSIQVDRTSTDEEGHYLFFQLGAGTFIVSVEPPPPASRETRQVEFLTGEEGSHRREDFVLDQPGGHQPPAIPNEPLFIQKIPAEAESAYRRATDRLREGKKKEAVAELTRAVNIFPDYFLALNQLGLESLQRGDVQNTHRWFGRAAAVNPNSATAHFGLGWAYYQAEQLPKAAEELRSAVKLNSQASEPYWFLGLTAVELRQWQEAETALRTFLQRYQQSDRPQAHLYLTSVYSELGRYDSAVDSLEKYLRSVPKEQRTQKLRDLLAQLKRKRDRR